ncbi:MAG: hypothetical protein TH68_06050 [Candidatus Synechococcus spongiarum 142]|uniref:Uncharacterized protein n=1 Tax=Candidatus Synechococcus spongiarum 142 TaxID=1608213 RepID=A0A6N3XAV9_9SYNE|nr:MAG: hypothetical protein TH68_06050 [Candidatus Synechococcus spongiarum 142]
MSSSSTRRCQVCQACWIGPHLFWSTGARGNNLDLAGLVCNTGYGGGLRCANPAKGQSGGDTWEQREAWIRGATLPGDVGREPLAA